jgi:hypothetical protein
MNVLLDYVFKVSSITPTAAADTSFLKGVLCVVKKKIGGVDDVITECTSKAAVAALTDNTDCDALFDAGMSKIYVLTKATLDMNTQIDAAENNFYTILISSDFVNADLSALDVGSFRGVVGMTLYTAENAAAFAATENHVGFYGKSANKSENLFYAFGKMMSNSLNWRNQQFITLPNDDEITLIGDAETLYEDRVSFAITDATYGTRLAFFCVGGKAIVAPYILRNFEIDLQSEALQYISGNQPAYTKKEAALLENALKDVLNQYIEDQWIEEGSVSVTLEEDNFQAAGDISVMEPKALWRVFAEITQTV